MKSSLPIRTRSFKLDKDGDTLTPRKSVSSLLTKPLNSNVTKQKLNTSLSLNNTNINSPIKSISSPTSYSTPTQSINNTSSESPSLTSPSSDISINSIESPFKFDLEDGKNDSSILTSSSSFSKSSSDLNSSFLTQHSSYSAPINNSNQMIKVCVRIKPIQEFQGNKESKLAWDWTEDNQIKPSSVHIASNPSQFYNRRPLQGINNANDANSLPLHYSFDYVFGPQKRNEDIFSLCIKDIVHDSMRGIHGSIFSYGQTSSGKTFTMNGVEDQPGIIILAINQCFDSINLFPDREFLIRISYLEIYNEQLKDLLCNIENGVVTNQNNTSNNIKIQFDPRLGTVLSGCKEHIVTTSAQVFSLLKHGVNLRHIGSTDMNDKSSRSHTILRIVIESKERNNNSNNNIRVSTLNLVDLAGSENAKMTNSKGERLKEAGFINKSLLTLSTIIQKLSEEYTNNPSLKSSKLTHLPYRNSKLTRLLESALDGNARICIICTISPNMKCVEETINTLKFASRAKTIKLQAKINENIDDKTLLKVYREEIEQLKLRLKQFEDRKVISPPSSPKNSCKINNKDQDILGNIEYVETNSFESSSDESNHDSNFTTNVDENIMQKTAMLKMIEEMEKLILKADSKSLSKKNSFLLQSNGLTTSSTMVKSPPSPKITTPQRKKDSQKSKLDKLHLNFPDSSLQEEQKSSINSTETSLENSTQIEDKIIINSTSSSLSSTMRSENDNITTILDSNNYTSPRTRLVSISKNDETIENYSSDFLGCNNIQYENLINNLPIQSENNLVVEEDCVLEGVSKMLVLLKGFIAGTNKEKEDLGSMSDVNLSPISTPNTDNKKFNFIDSSNSSPNFLQKHNPNSPLSPTSPYSPSSSPSYDTITISRKEYEKLKRDYQLKEADNAFLHSELVKKNDILNILTEGLKEVEESQKQWLHTNQQLSVELERQIIVNNLFKREIFKLTNIIKENCPHCLEDSMVNNSTPNETIISSHTETSIENTSNEAVHTSTTTSSPFSPELLKQSSNNSYNDKKNDASSDLSLAHSPRSNPSSPYNILTQSNSMVTAKFLQEGTDCSNISPL